MPGDLEAARLRLVPSDGEIACPMKGQIAVGRCLQLQGETAAEGRPCTCDVFRARQGTLPRLEVIVDEPPADPIAEVVRKHVEPKAPAPDRRALIAAAAAKKKETIVPKEWIGTEEICELFGGVDRSLPGQWFKKGWLGKDRQREHGKAPYQYQRAAVLAFKAQREKGAPATPKATKAPAAEPAQTPPPNRSERPMPRSSGGKVDQVLELAARVTELRVELAAAEEELVGLVGGA
jgi:hypothetical protein